METSNRLQGAATTPAQPALSVAQVLDNYYANASDLHGHVAQQIGIALSRASAIAELVRGVEPTPEPSGNKRDEAPTQAPDGIIGFAYRNERANIAKLREHSDALRMLNDMLDTLITRIVTNDGKL